MRALMLLAEGGLAAAAQDPDAKDPDSRAPDAKEQAAKGPDAPPALPFEALGRRLTCEWIDLPDPEFDPASDRDARRALVRTLAFSCNYRDRAWIVRELERSPLRATAFGSEFCARVEAVGRDVKSLAPGDLVLGNNAWPRHDLLGARPGIPTSRASLGMHVFHEAALRRVPESMRPEEAAAFSLGAQTASAIARRLASPAGARVLVAGARSNTALFVIQRLARRDVHVEAITRSEDPRAEAMLLSLGARVVHRAPPEREEGSGYFGVVDPFPDLNAASLMPLLEHGGRYLFCGVADDLAARPDESATFADARWRAEILPLMIARNLRLEGSCLGETVDLSVACADFPGGRLRPVLDSVFEAEDARAFFLRTFADPARLGKVVLMLPDASGNHGKTARARSRTADPGERIR